MTGSFGLLTGLHAAFTRGGQKAWGCIAITKHFLNHGITLLGWSLDRVLDIFKLGCTITCQWLLATYLTWEPRDEIIY